MLLDTVSIKNFRGIADIALRQLNPRINVIVGPNAIGKSTILEAIRFAKGVLAPRAPNETVQVLTSLRAATPHQPQQLIPDGIARARDQPIEVDCTFVMTMEEVGQVEAAAPQIATRLVQSRMGVGTNPAAFTAFIGSPLGKNALKQAEQEVRNGINRLKTNRQCRLNMAIDFRTERVVGADPIQAACFQFLEQSLPPHQSLFSYFPADRALPPGEQPIQLGVQDAVQQLEAHNSTPHTKYQRVKNSIFGAAVMSDAARQSQMEEFDRIFTGLLTNRKIVGPRINQFGQLSIDVMEADTGTTFDIDAMSSGEKNLVLTWLLVATSVTKNGIILMDEPELHLNPAVCKNILPFLIDNYVVRNGVQAIICSHSPEILAGAFNRSECSLWHLRGPDLIAPVRRQDKEEVTEALRLLGTSEVEGLLYIGTIFVEGEHDKELLEIGFGELLSRYMIKDLGGRRAVEQQITILQQAEDSGEELSTRYFIFDRDTAPTDLRSSKSVKLLQWDRRCIENYLLDFDALTDLLKGKEIGGGEKVTNVAQVERLLRGLAVQQLDELAVREIYLALGYDNPSLRSRDVEDKLIPDAANELYKRISVVAQQLTGIHENSWKTKFISDANMRRKDLETSWSMNWPMECDGKKLFRSLQRNIDLGMSLLDFKKAIMSRTLQVRSSNWQIMAGHLSALIERPSG
jgi:predicted ATPase